ncbi:unnamed protein product [Sphagnum jensenii]|uniref:Uncharacterized protein n=1 Tax=Sphagnum jensenii TaxID=128206 RepID=A0ABP1AJH5_9BRYO
MAQFLHLNSTSVVRHIPAFCNTALRPASSMKQCQSIAHGCAEKRWRRTSRRSYLKSVRALLNPGDDPILKEVLKEPIAFFGGVFAGLPQLDLKEEPLREWVAWTSEAAGLDLSESPSADDDDSIPEDIQID